MEDTALRVHVLLTTVEGITDNLSDPALRDMVVQCLVRVRRQTMVGDMVLVRALRGMVEDTVHALRGTTVDMAVIVAPIMVRLETALLPAHKPVECTSFRTSTPEVGEFADHRKITECPRSSRLCRVRMGVFLFLWVADPKGRPPPLFVVNCTYGLHS